MIGVKVRMVTKPEVIRNKILDICKANIVAAFTKAAPIVTKDASKMIRDAIYDCPEFQSILGGRLRGELGIVNSREAMSNLLFLWTKSVKVQYTQVRRQGITLTGRFRLTAIDTSYEDVLSSPYASYLTEKGQNIPWLEWMLTFGDRIIVRDYYVRGNPLFSRTGTVVMSKSKGRSWRVPPEYSGTPRNNFVTRATDSILEPLSDVIINTIRAQL